MSEQEPLVSVIVPIYKVERYLDQCVTSIVNQTYRNLEIILVDDGSPDRCPQLCDEWAQRDERIRVIHKTNGGLSSARNAGLDNAHGDRIAFVDSDDFIDSNMLNIMNGWMNDHAEADAVMCGTIKSYDDGRMEQIDEHVPERLFSSEEALHDFLYHRNRMASAVWNKIFDARLFTKENGIRFPEGLNSEDYYLLAHIYRVMRGIYFNPKGLYYYRIRNDSITTAKINKHSFDKAIIADKCCDYLESHSCGTKFGRAYFRMQGRYDVVYDLVDRKADSGLIAHWRRELKKTARDVYKDPEVSRGRKLKLFAMCMVPRLYYKLTQR